jgi:hypothetical protein
MGLLRCPIGAYARPQFRLGRDLSSGRRGKLFEGSRKAKVDRFVKSQFVVSAAEILDEGEPGDHDFGAVVGPESAHWAQVSLGCPWSAPSMRLFAYCSVRCQAASANSSSTFGYTAALSVTHFHGHAFRRSARSKNRRAAAASRRSDTNTSVTCPNWSIAR